MNQFIDFEFLEGDIPVKILGMNIPKWLIKPNNTIQPISVGLVSDDNREYYAISKEFNLREAWDRYDLVINKQYPLGSEYNKVYWIRENVLKPIFQELLYKGHKKAGIKLPEVNDKQFTYNNLQKLVNKYGKTNKQIAEDVVWFCAAEKSIFETDGLGQEVRNRLEDNPVKFYGYYSAYDHVCLSWLYGKMIDLPTGFPMFTIDLKQELDNYIRKTWDDVKDSTWGHEGVTLERLKQHKDYPKQTNTHHALFDARFNKELYEFLNKL